MSRGGLWLFVLLGVAACDPAPTPETAEQPDAAAYARWALIDDPGALKPPGGWSLAGRAARCLDRATVLNPHLADYGQAFSTFVVLNPDKLRTQAGVVQMWIYGHECGHVARGPDETQADCYGIEKGLKEGWMDRSGLEAVCAFIRTGRPDGAHPAGPQRCEAMRACFAAASARGEGRSAAPARAEAQ